MSCKIIYLIEVKQEDSDTWTAMYQPCYSRLEADRKREVKARLFGTERVRVSMWEWIGSGPLFD